MMRIVRSKFAGACYGVKRALELVEAAAGAATASVPGAATPIHTLGPLIHNPQVVAELQQRGVAVVDSVDDVDAGILVLRSHGVAPQVAAAAEAKGLEVVDATCPHVSKAQDAARELAAAGLAVIIVGEPGHPEVEAISAYAGEQAIVVQEPANLPLTGLPSAVGVVVQTTQSTEALAAIIEALQARGIKPEVRNTICFATRQRQEAAQQLAAEMDVMVVVGGRNSGNTTRLAEICRVVCPRTYHIERPEELQPDWFISATSIGLTAGASTPEQQIIAVEKRLREMLP